MAEDTVQAMREGLGWAPVDGPEEQAAHARMGGQPIPEPTPPAPVVAQSVPTPVAAPSAPAPAPQAPYEPIPAALNTALMNKANQEAMAYKQQLMQAGWEDQAAHYAASQYARAQYADSKAQALLVANENMAKGQVVQRLAAQYGVDAASLHGYADPAAMEAAAKAQATLNKRLAALEAARAVPKTPVQSFDSGEGTAQSPMARKIAYATGKISLTTAEYKELFGR